MVTRSYRRSRALGAALSAATLCVVLGGPLACSSDDDGGGTNAPGDEGGTGTGERVGGELLEASAIEVPEALGAAVAARRFDYSMDAVDGSGTVAARAILYEPGGPAPADGFPLVVWAHGTTGIANACAPSLSFEDFGNEVAIGALLEAGYAVLAPDYEGFGTPVIHPYYVRSSHAESVRDAVPAAHALDGIALSDAWALVGHSQGGHVALSAARAAEDPDYPLAAVVALAPGTDLRPFSDLAFEAIDLELAAGELQLAAERTFYLNVYGAYVAHANALLDPGFEPGSLFGEDVAPLIDRALDEERCGDYAASVSEVLSAHLQTGATLAEFGGLRRDWYEESGFAERLAAEGMNDEAQAAPLLVVQGRCRSTGADRGDERLRRCAASGRYRHHLRGRRGRATRRCRLRRVRPRARLAGRAFSATLTEERFISASAGVDVRSAVSGSPPTSFTDVHPRRGRRGALKHPTRSADRDCDAHPASQSGQIPCAKLGSSRSACRTSETRFRPARATAPPRRVRSPVRWRPTTGSASAPSGWRRRCSPVCSSDSTWSPASGTTSRRSVRW